MATTSDTAAAPQGEDELQARQGAQVLARLPAMELAAVMESGRHFPLPYMIVLSGLCYVMYDTVPSFMLVGWACIYAAYIVARTVFTQAYFRCSARLPVGAWRAGVAVSATCHGLVLGSLAFIGLPYLPADEGMAVLVAVISVCVSGTVYAASVLPALNLLTLCALLPYVIGWQLNAPSGGLHPLAIVVFGLMVVFLYMNRRHHRVLQHNLVLHANQELLLDDLAGKNRQLKVAQAARTRLLATASHDLRQPVHTLGLLIDRLDVALPDDQLNARFAQLEHASSIVSDMLGELMDLSQLENRNYQTRIAPLELDALLEQVRLNYAHQARSKAIAMTVQLGGLRVRSDPRLLRRVLFNLTANAIRYTQAGSVTVSAHTEGASVIVTIADTGPGIAAAQLPHIFDDYTRLGDDEAGEALGLGLGIVRRACHLLEHAVSVDSAVGSGTAVHVRLPLAERQPEPGTLTSGPAVRPRHTILVIENDHVALYAMCELLAAWNHECIALSTGDALAATLDTAVTISAVISDLHLAEATDGFALIAQARRLTGRADLPALLVTGDVSPALARRATEAHVVLAHKPLSPQQLRREIDALLP